MAGSIVTSVMLYEEKFSYDADEAQAQKHNHLQMRACIRLHDLLSQKDTLSHEIWILILALLGSNATITPPILSL